MAQLDQRRTLLICTPSLRCTPLQARKELKKAGCQAADHICLLSSTTIASNVPAFHAHHFRPPLANLSNKVHNTTPHTNLHSMHTSTPRFKLAQSG
jgi:hypothetical protein